MKRKIRSLFEIAPLHNPANLEGVLSIEKVLPGTPQVTVFDTSFHQTIPAMNYLYALPHAYYEKISRAQIRFPRHEPPLRGAQRRRTGGARL